MVDARLLELNKVCRTCLKDVESEEELISIFLSIQDLSISRSQISYCEMLKIILPSNLVSAAQILKSKIFTIFFIYLIRSPTMTLIQKMSAFRAFSRFGYCLYLE